MPSHHGNESGDCIKKLEQLDAFRRPDRFEQFLLACEADTRGRAGLEDNHYPQAKYFKEALDAANEVNGKALQNKGIEGQALGKEINRQRVEKIKLLKSSK